MATAAWAKIEWECSKKCPNYDKCMAPGGARRLESTHLAEDKNDKFLDTEPLTTSQ